MECIGLQMLRKYLSDHGVEGTANIRYQEPDQVAASPTHDSRCGIRNVSKFLGCEPHPLLCLPTDAGMVGKRPTNGSYRKIELLGDVLYRDHNLLVLKEKF